ncbi:raffinose/stachyose/melibiose transport system substrate-binding protein [Arthrobacter stackebrandtii]|uniref:Raffinose/stachyose/melibiose transport system substrate-binding protein n=1 Tax=Arthrobacter stackebrandtii TaxID=272161 RepID=A0ABS4Z2V8_9MICC|nr:extracellular solute-binding protein [Arthrobacter stackebrandtii]MBP2415032.1 raffinose/stachyose/melibiose transport system substrate-binding protein [Arthrobacter stackebrandtii]PYH00820.1 sugar ABC transporter substrate-binding protein [Arthrobacter stackebrandtii]
MKHQPTSRRSFLSLAALLPLAAAGISACGTSGPGGVASGASMWSVSGDPNETIRKNSVEAFGKANPDNTIKVTFFQNDAYKTKVKTAIGAGQAPTIIYGWGGGILKSYAEASQVEDLTGWFADNPDVKDRLFASSFGAATVDGKIYAIPATTVQPIIFYYNKELFAQAGVQPPKTWDDLMSLVKTFNAKGIAPLSLGGQSRWTSMMWLEYMFDRVGGPEVFNDIYAGKPEAWSNPAAIEALAKIQELVAANGFIKGFSSITADSNADQALLFTGKAAMMLHGSWTYGSMKNDGAGFVQEGKLGWVDFPAVAGGKGDAKNTVGNPSNYLSISAQATDADKESAKKFFKEGLLQEDEVSAYISNGGVPVVNGIEDKLAATDDADFLGYVYALSKNAPNFQQSWDQALSPVASEALLNNIDQLFVMSITPEQFATNMNATLGK